jgi:hypothetical protein
MVVLFEVKRILWSKNLGNFVLDYKKLFFNYVCLKLGHIYFY